MLVLLLLVAFRTLNRLAFLITVAMNVAMSLTILEFNTFVSSFSLLMEFAFFVVALRFVIALSIGCCCRRCAVVVVVIVVVGGVW